MDIKNDEIRISTVNFTKEGDKLEPEEQAAARILTGTAPLTHGTTKLAGNIPMQVIGETTVGDLARTFRRQCRTCKHFDHDNWVRILRTKALSEVRTDQEELNKLRAGLLQTQNASVHDMHLGQDGDIDIEHALASLGICRALTETLNDAIIVHPLSSCPDDVITPTSPDGFYQAKDDHQDKEAASAYDLILRKAMGRIT